MPQQIDQKNLAALLPLFPPWEQPLSHRVKNEQPGQPAVIRAGRRPSSSTPVRAIRTEVDAWRQAGYPGVSPTSRVLLRHWFFSEHLVDDGNGGSLPFHYYWPQREAIETIIYLFELKGIKNLASLISEFYGEQADQLFLRIHPSQDRWPKHCCKIATGGGKTKVMSLAVVWSYFHSLFEPNSPLARHFVIIAPNLTVYERLKYDFENRKIFTSDSLIPPEWASDFNMEVVLQDQAGGAATTGAIYLTNIHHLYPKKEKKRQPADASGSLVGPDVKRAQVFNTGQALRARIAAHPVIMVMNDEAHHLHDDDLAWNRALDTLHSQSLALSNRGVCLQLDFTATPKHNNGSLFEHIICDFPLGEAVDAGIVKVPVIGESSELKVITDRNAAAHQRYAMHLKLGYERYRHTLEELGRVRKPLLFVMTEDARSADEIAAYLDSDLFPELKDKVLNLHTRLKGKIKIYKRGGRDVKEFVESETGISSKDLDVLRQMSRDLDGKDSPYRCIVSVMMLREGWDIRNVTTIVPLRPYSAKSQILPEQTLGRGLRRMFPQGDIPELVTVVDHPAFKNLYEQELQQEGFDIVVAPLSERIRQTATIYVDFEQKPVANLEIELPMVTDAIETRADLTGLAMEEIEAHFRAKFLPLPIGKAKNEKVEYKESHLFTDEVIMRMQLDAGLLARAYSAIDYYAQELGRACHVSNPHQSLHSLLEQFVSRLLFERPVDLYSGEVDHRLADADVREFIRATFTPLILNKIVHKKERRASREMRNLSAWAPFQTSSTERTPAIPAHRTMFNLVPCDSDLEVEFVDLCGLLGDVLAFAKNAGPQKLMIDYIRPDGARALYVPDFFVRSAEGTHYMVELKGKPDNLVPIKARAAVEWCKSASKAGARWEYVYIPFHILQQGSFSSIAALARACQPALTAILEEALSGQLALPLEQAQAQKEFADFFSAILARSNVPSLPLHLNQQVSESADALFYAIKTGKRNLAGAFLNLLALVEQYSLAILDAGLRPSIPAAEPDRDAYFNPYVESLPGMDKNSVINAQRRLKNNLIYGRSHFRLGTLLFCLRFAAESGWHAPGVWQDVKRAFQSDQFSALFGKLEKVSEFRNAHVHGETELSDSTEAEVALSLLISCLVEMSNFSN